MCGQYLYSKSSGNTFRSIQILPLLGGQVQKKKNSRHHSFACHWEKKRLIRCLFATKLSTAQGPRTPALNSKLSVPFSTTPQLQGPRKHIPWKETDFPKITTHPFWIRKTLLLKEVISCPSVLSIWVQLIDFDDFSTWISLKCWAILSRRRLLPTYTSRRGLDVTMTPWLYRIIKQPAYAILNQHWITLQLFITSRCIGTCRPRE